MIEIFANLILLISLTPKSILGKFERMNCFKSAPKNAIIINSETTALEPKYIDDFDFKAHLTQTYLDNYEYSEECTDLTDPDDDSQHFDDTKYYSG